MAICVQAPNIHSLNTLLPLAIPTTYYLFYCGGRSNHRILISLSLVGQMRCILKVVERMAICVQAPNIHSLNTLLPLAIPTTYYLFYCGGRSSHRLLLKESLSNFRYAGSSFILLGLIGVVGVANLALP